MIRRAINIATALAGVALVAVCLVAMGKRGREELGATLDRLESL